jgi:ketopantoate hydroxymethyltransferase
MQSAFIAYIADVQGHTFPAAEHTIDMPAEEWDALVQNLNR